MQNDENTLTTKIIDYRDSFVNTNESYSSKRVLPVGVPQGSVLRPVLYLMYTSPLQERKGDVCPLLS